MIAAKSFVRFSLMVILAITAITVKASPLESSIFKSSKQVDFRKTSMENIYQGHHNIDEIEWWKKETYYHIYIRSFKDTDGNGQGDLRGVIQELDYIKSLGIGVIVLSPFYKSPMKDSGYDISDYCSTNEDYGTMKDVEELIEGAHKRGMHVIVDFVPNHTSNQHEWFRKSERALIEPAKYGKYKDYYVWSNSTRYDFPGVGGRPSNWLSLFGGGTAWRWSPVRKEFYLHQFLPEQPDLNLRDPGVREELKEVARFWLRKKVDGLRVDAVLHFLEAADFRDEPIRPEWRLGMNPYDRLLHIYTRLEEGDSVVADWRQVASEFDGDRVIITEADASVQRVIKYYGAAPEHRYADMPFNFELIRLREERLTSRNIKSIIMSWLKPVEELGWPREKGVQSPLSNWVLGNHDQPRLINRIGERNFDTFLWIAFLLPGVPFLFAGDEYGQYNADYNKIPQSTLDEGEPTRLIFRSPMMWNSSEPSAGFSSNPKTWMPISDNFREYNILNQLRTPGRTHLKSLLELQELRKKYLETVVFGELTFFENSSESSRVLAMARYHHRFPSLLVLINFDDHYSSNVRLTPTTIDGVVHVVVPEKGRILMNNYADVLTIGQTVRIRDLVLGPNQGLVLKLLL